MTIRKVDAMIIGGDRSGTKWLRSLCAQHPDIFFCPVSQRQYLSKQEATKRRIFGRMKFNCPTDDYQGEKIVLGMRNMQPYHPDKVAKMYYSHNKDMKFVVSTRNPLDRTFSQYVVRMNKRIRQGENRATFDINEELSVDEPHVRRSHVHKMLGPYLDLFPREQFFVYPMEMLMQETNLWLNKVFAFLGVHENIPLRGVDERANPGRYDSAEFVPINATSERFLIELYSEETKAMSELSGVDLAELWGLKSGVQ